MKIFSTCCANLRNSDPASLETLEPRILRVTIKWGVVEFVELFSDGPYVLLP